MRAADKISTAVDECVSVATEAQSPIDSVRRFIDKLRTSGEWTSDEIREVLTRVTRAMGRSEDEFQDPPVNITTPMRATANELVQLIKPGDKITAYKKTYVAGAVRLIDGGWWLDAHRGTVGMLIPIQQVARVNGRLVTLS